MRLFNLLFEWDIEKNALNIIKHEIPFEKAVDLWSDSFSKELLLSYAQEERWMRIGKLDQKVSVAIFAWRGKNVRLISVRRARKKEENFYEQE